MEVTVVMTVYNGEEYLQESIDSILNQTYINYEFIIINDGSTDQTKSLLDEIKDNRVQVIHRYPNQGSVSGLNYAISKAKGKWIAIQDADDISHPERLEKQIEYLRTANHVVGLGSFIECIVGSKGSELNLKSIADYWNNLLTKEAIDNEMLRGNPLCHGSVIFLKDAFFQVGGYNPKYKIAYDWELWIKLWRIGLIEKIPQVLYYYRIHADSLSQQDWKVTHDEIMTISVRYIRKYKYKDIKRPIFIVIGTQKSCSNFKKKIIPNSKIIIRNYVYKEFNDNLNRSHKMFKKGEVNGFLVLNGENSKLAFKYLFGKGYILNKNIFRIGF